MPPSFPPLCGFGLGEGCWEVEGSRREKVKVILTVSMGCLAGQNGDRRGPSSAQSLSVRPASPQCKED